MVNIKINNKELSVSKELTILQAASLANIQIPRFCYHEKLTIAGNCRMCLVEMAKVNKPVASCALPVSEGMQVYTNSILVKKAREGVLELLLANHPLDCPICDQGGECDLQEQAMIFGNDRSRFYEIKRAVSDKTISPFVKTIMTRCIHCTRCVRFLNEIAGVNELGMTGRGSNSEIGTYIRNSISSELSGNIIDLCPVGALTSKPYAFTARPWELRSVETIDIFDALGTNIKVDTRGPNLMRILPKINEQLNEEWITDKTRFSFDGYKAQRLTAPMYSHPIAYVYNFNKNNIIEKSRIFLNCSWDQAFLIFREFFSIYSSFIGSSTNIILGNNVNYESLILLKNLRRAVGFNNIQDQYSFFNFSDKQIYYNSLINSKSNDFISNYSLNISPVDLEKTDVCLLVGTNLRLENPLLNSRLRKSFILNNSQIASIGPTVNSLYNNKKLGNSLNTLIRIFEGKHAFNSVLLTAKNPLILFGSYFDFNSIVKLKNYLERLFKRINKNIIFGFVNSHIGKPITNDVNILTSPFKSSNLSKSFNFIINADEFSSCASQYTHNDLQTVMFNVYMGFQADRSAGISDLIFPTASPLEESATYADINGSSVKTNICLPAPTGARTSWKILFALLSFFNINKSLKEDIEKQINFSVNSKLASSSSYTVPTQHNKITLPNTICNNFIANYYKTNSVTRNSRIMSQMTKQKTFAIRF